MPHLTGRVDVKIPPRVDKAWCDSALDYEAIPQFRKTSLTRAIRMAGPFTVETSEGPLRCEDGWLCFDARGYPYPVAADEFELIYEPATTERADLANVHPATAALLRFFDYQHLPAELAAISRDFYVLAQDIAHNPALDGPEVTVALRKLLEAKDCAVRARLATMNLG